MLESRGLSNGTIGEPLGISNVVANGGFPQPIPVMEESRTQCNMCHQAVRAGAIHDEIRLAQCGLQHFFLDRLVQFGSSVVVEIQERCEPNQDVGRGADAAAKLRGLCRKLLIGYRGVFDVQRS
jgi:hypothetical protein